MGRFYRKQTEIVVYDYIKLLRMKNIRIEKTILFGSCSAGRAHEDSDIDVALIGPDFGRDRIEEMVMLKEIAEEIDYDLSPRPYSVEQFKRASKGEFIYEEVIKKRKIIVV